MSVLETLHAEHKARQARFASAARIVKPSKPTCEPPPEPNSGLKILDRITAAPRRFNPCDEHAWRVVVEGVETDYTPKVPIKSIMREVCRHFDLTEDELRSEARILPLVRARYVFTHLCRKLSARSFPEIGRALRKDHSTQIHAAKQIVTLMREDEQLRASVEMLIDHLGGAAPE